MDAPDLENVTGRAGALATALVAVAVVARWSARVVCGITRKLLGADRVGKVEERLASVEGKVDELAADTSQRLSNIEGQVSAILALLSSGRVEG